MRCFEAYSEFNIGTDGFIPIIMRLDGAFYLGAGCHLFGDREIGKLCGFFLGRDRCDSDIE